MTTRQAAAALNGTITNFLSSDEQYFETSIGSWTATNASIVRNVAFRLKETYHTLEVHPQTTQQVVLTINPKQINATFSTDYLTFYFFVYCTKRTQFEVEISHSLNESQTETVIANALTWTIVRGPKLQIPQIALPITANVTITADSHAGAKFYIGHPNLVNTLHLIDNLFLRQCMTYIPEVLIEADRNQTLPDFPLLRILDIATMYANRGVNQLDAYRYRDIASGYDETNPSTKSKLINPDVAETAFLSWLAQIVGVKITQVGGGTTPWGNFPSTWEAFLDAIDNAGDDDDIAEWFEIEGFNVRDSNFDSSARQQIKTAETGYKAGLIASFEEILKITINGNQEYKIYNDPVALPWTILVRTLVSETPGGVEGEPSEILLGALNKCKPMGFVIDHRCVAAL